MADGNKQENPLEGQGCGETKEEIDEDEEEIEFPFDLSEEWMVIDVDDDEDDDDEIKNDSLSKDSHSHNEKDCASKSQAKEPQNSDTAKPSNHKSQSPKKSTEKPRDLKEKVSQKDLSSSKKSDFIGDSASARSTSQTLVKPAPSQEKKGNAKKDCNVPSKSLSNQSSTKDKDTSVKKRPEEDKRDAKASKSTGKNVSAVEFSRVSTRAASNANTKEIEKTSASPQITQQTTKDRSEKTNDKTAQSPKSSNPEIPVSSTKTPSAQKTQKLPEKTSSGKTTNNIDHTSKTTHPESSASSTKNSSSQGTQKLPDKMSSGKTNTSTNQTPKSSHPYSSASSTKPSSPQKTQKPPNKAPTGKTPVKASSGKTNNSGNQIPKSSHPESSATSTKPLSLQKTPKPPDKGSFGKTNYSTNQASQSESSASSPKPSPSQKSQKPPNKALTGKTSNSTPQTTTSAAGHSTQIQKAALCKAPSKNLSSVEKSQAGSQSQVSGKRKDDKSTEEKITVSKSDNKSTAVKVTSSSAASVSSMSVSTSENKPPKEKMIASETKTLTRSSTLNKVCERESVVSSDQVPSSSANDTISKTHGVIERANNGGQKNTSLHFRSPDSNKVSQNNVRASEVIPVEKKHSHVDHGKQQKSAQKQMKPVRNLESTGEIAEAMAAGNIELCDIQVHDLDLKETSVENKVAQSKPVQSAAFSPKKRPSQSSCENVVKKAKYEEKDTDIHFQDSGGYSDMQKDDIKGSKPGEKELSVHKQSAKRIVRRFHRTTQTLPKTTANQLLQCSLGQPPSGSSSKKQQNNCGIQCKIGEHFEGVISRISSNLTPVVDALNQEVFKAVLAFDASPIHQDIVTPGTYKYGLRLGQVSQSDVEKNFFKDNCIKKADSYTVSFWKKDCGIVDLLFYEEENFISVLNQIRKSRLESRYLCVSVVKRKTDEETDSENLWNYLKATVILDQNFVSTGYLSYYKTPIWSKPKVDEFITMHNVPGGIPLSFLNTVFPDAITILMRDVKAKFTMKGGGVRLGMSRKNGSSTFLKLFKQVLINNSPVVLTQGLSDKKDIPEVQETSKVVAELEKVERERQREKLSLRSVTATPRDINDGKKKTKAEGKGSSHGTISSPADTLRKDTVKGLHEAKCNVDSDLSDISELSFSGNNLDNGQEGVKPSRANEEPPQKKIEPKKSLNVTMGSKLLNRARSNLHQAKSKRQERSSGKMPVKSRETRRNPERHSIRTREDSSRRSGTALKLSKHSRRDECRQRDDSRRVEGRQRDESHNRQSGSLQKERLRSNMSREKGSIDRSSEGSGTRHSQRRQREQDHNRARQDQSPARHFRRPRSSNRSPERQVLVRSSNRMPRSQERHVGGERVRMREGEGNSYMEYSHPSPPMGDSRVRRISLENTNDVMADLRRSSEDLRSVLDARKPRHVRLSPRRHGSEERIRFDSPGRQRRSRSPERRKRPLSRSPSPRYRKVLIGRRSLSPKNRSRRQRGGDSPQPHMTQSPRPGMDVVARDPIGSKAPDFRSVQAAIHSHSSGEQATKEESMRISKSLFVKLLTNALHGEGGDVVDENLSQTAKSYSPHRDDTGRVLSQIRSHEPQSGKDERAYGNIDSFKNYAHNEHRRPDFEEDRSHYEHSGPSKGNFGQGSISRGDVRPIPPPVLPPILTSSSTNFPVNKFDPLRPHEEVPSSSSSQISQGVWAVPSSSSFSFPGNVRPPPMTDRPPFPPPNREALPPPQNHPPFNTHPPMMFMNTRPPFQPPQGPMPNLPQGIPPPRTGMWQNPRPGPF